MSNKKKSAEVLLKDSEEKLRSIFSAAPVGIGLVVNRVLMEVNNTFCRMTGYSRKELIGKSSEILYPDKEEFDFVGREKYEQITKLGMGSVETRFKCKNGKILNVVLSSAPLDNSDLTRGVTFTVLDITDRITAEQLLRLSEEKFRSIAENLSDVIFITDDKGILKYISPASRSFGYEPEECINKFFGEFIPTTELEKAMSVFKNALNSINTETNSSVIFNRKDGTQFYAELSGSPFKFADDKNGVLGLLRDISDKMRWENELRKVSQAVEQSPVSIIITDNNGTIEYFNPKLCEVTGYSKGELIGKNPRILSSGEKSKGDYEELWKTIKAGNEWKGEFHNKKKSGEFYWESASISPIKNDKNEITHFIAIKEDITLRKILETSIIESEKRYKELFLNNPVPTYIFDIATLEFVEVNDATVLKYGYSREKFASMTLKDIHLPEDVPDLIESIERLNGNVFQSVTMRHVRRDGTVFPVEITSHSLPEKNRRKTRLVMATDISERVKAAEQMKLAKEKAEASDNLKTTFLNNISHEVRTPLNGILGFAEIISQPDLSIEDRYESLSMLSESSDRLLNTITNFMDISLLTSGNLSVNKKVFFPGEKLRKTYNNYLKKCSDRGLELILEIEEKYNNISIYTDPEILQKILIQLFNNAIKFTEKGSIHYGFIKRKDTYEFFVRDSGIGIGEESVESIFDRFVKEERGASFVTEGSGLGLSVAKGMTSILGGTIRVESQSGKGSCFYFTIPDVNNITVHEAVKTDREIKEKSAKISILVAEDDETNFFYLNSILKRETEAKIIHALTGREAIDIFKSESDIQLILMDIKMPDIDGLEATRQIKQIDKKIPIIAITAYAMSGDAERIIDAGCDGYLSKPISKYSLMEKLAEFIKI
jgi:PAS domain S-box-containing protein